MESALSVDYESSNYLNPVISCFQGDNSYRLPVFRVHFVTDLLHVGR